MTNIQVLGIIVSFGLLWTLLAACMGIEADIKREKGIFFCYIGGSLLMFVIGMLFNQYYI